MPDYSIFGSRLRSAVALPELHPLRDPGAGRARWTLRIAQTASSISEAGPGELLGTDTVMAGVTVRLYRHAGGYRLAYDDTGCFDISRDGHDIVWTKGPRAAVEAARLDIINRVLPVALHASGTFCLHGSAVSLQGRGLAFLAPRCYGKSTLAMALAENGARILTDDALAVDAGTLAPGAPVLARPGVHSVRLFDDAARALVGDADRLQAVGAYPMPRRDLRLLSDDRPAITKQILRGLPPQQLMQAPVPLVAIYVLEPARADGQVAAAARTLVPAVRAALTLVEQAKSGVLLGKSEAPTLRDRAARVSRQVPVYRLTVLRDLDRIADVAKLVATWHRPPPSRHTGSVGPHAPT